MEAHIVYNKGKQRKQSRECDRNSYKDRH